MKEEQEYRRRHKAEQAKWDQIWMKRATEKGWDQIRTPLEAYRYSGFKEEVTSDPRRTPEYVKQILDELGVAKGAPPLGGPTEHDMDVVREMITRKAAVFWIEGIPRTTLLHLMHDTRPTGPPARTPPHDLKAEDAQFVDEKLMEEVQTGQLERGNSPW
eukprot:2028145-Pyramimonas_sp.AAC.1